MISAFSSVYTALQGFLSRSFWFAAFLPVALFAALHAVVAALALGPISVFGIPLSLEKDIPAAALATAVPAVIIGLVILAYSLQPLMPRFRGLLDGSLLPPGLHDWLRRARQAEADATRAHIDASRADLAALRDLQDNVDADDGRLPTAYGAAEARPTALNADVVQQAATSLQALEHAISKKDPMATLAAAAETAVINALAVNNPDPASVPADQADLARRTNGVADRFEGLLADAVREAVYRYQIMQTRIRVAGALEHPRATLIGDAGFVVERYARDVYQVDFNFLWPRLLVAMRAEKADDPMLDTIESARTRVDFAVLSLVLAVSIPAVWLPTLLIRGGSAWLFLAIGAATPVVLGFFYELVFESQLAFGDFVRTAIDKSRFLVLKMLRQPEPLTRGEERDLWTRIAEAEEDGRLAELTYVPTKSVAG